MNRKIPDVTAYCLDEALDMLIQNGMGYELQATSPPQRYCKTQDEAAEKIPEEMKSFRVVKQTLVADNTLKLLVARAAKGLK